MKEQPATGTILFEVALLTVVVLLVDEWLIRGALAFVPALLLAQRALLAGGSEGSGNSKTDDRRSDLLVRQYVTELLEHFRTFYATCHLMGAGGLTPEEALQRTHTLEKDLSRLMDEVKHEPLEMEMEMEPLPML